MKHRQVARNKGKYALWPVWALCSLLLVTIAVALTWMTLSERQKASDIAVVNLPDESEIHLKTADFQPGELRLFHVFGTNIVLAVKRLSDGKLYAALSTCTTACSRQRHSYAKKNELICGMCNQPMRFAGDQGTTAKATTRCPLPEVPIKDNAGEVLIATKSIVEVAHRAASQ